MNLRRKGWYPWCSPFSKWIFENKEPNQVNTIQDTSQNKPLIVIKGALQPDYHAVLYTYSNNPQEDNILDVLPSTNPTLAHKEPNQVNTIQSPLPSSILPPIQTSKPSTLQDDDWGTLDFTPTFHSKDKILEFENQTAYLKHVSILIGPL